LIAKEPISFPNQSPRSRRPTQWVGHVEFTCGTAQDAVLHVIEMAHAGVGRHVHLANAYTVSLADKSKGYRSVLADPAVNFPDGKPIGWVSRLHRDTPRLSQVRGPRLFLDVFDRGRESDVRHYLLGSTPEVLEKLTAELHRKFPGILIVGAESPPFRKLAEAEIFEQDARIRQSGAQIVWVGLGTPKQDVECRRLALSLPVVAMAVGAAFDFAAGTLRVAPLWMGAIGLEWAFRFQQEPRRLWRRYVFGNARFLKTALLPNKSLRDG
jgi:N-acetylglucosaminyldiphosphoundecaprenol N-acetyl-beta-D-mannosaminyltransferase